MHLAVSNLVAVWVGVGLAAVQGRDLKGMNKWKKLQLRSEGGLRTEDHDSLVLPKLSNGVQR